MNVRPTRRAATPRWSDGEMPREKINEIRTGTVIESSDPSVPVGTVVEQSPAVVQVNWHREGEWVQVAVEADVTYFRFAADTPNGETSDRSTVYSPPLTRDEINKLIRTLRRARDQVYGRDE